MCPGITLTTFSMYGNTPIEKDRLNMSSRRVEISFFNSFQILVGRLFGSVDLSPFSKGIIIFISRTSQGVINNDSAIRGRRKY